jgi:site-specific DNA-methyltransferase (adenine-specific)
MTVEILHGDCLDLLCQLQPESIDACVTDPPYELGFMGKGWDSTGIANSVDMWRAVYAALKPGGYLLAFSGTRTYHRMACAIEDAGFEIRDQIGWMYGTGFPKSHDVSKGIDKALGAERGKIRVDASEVRNPKATGAGRDGMEGATRPWIEAALERGYHEKDSDEPATPEASQWAGWGTALKPAWEPIVVARKPLIGTVAANVLAHGCGAMNIDASRIGTDEDLNGGTYAKETTTNGASGSMAGPLQNAIGREYAQPSGRWPANVIHDGSDEVEAAFAAFGERKSGALTAAHQAKGGFAHPAAYHAGSARGGTNEFAANSGTASRFFYAAKANKADRAGSKHPTVKPLALMRYLCKLVTPPGGRILDPFAGSGTTLQAADECGFSAVGIERESEYVADIRRRIEALTPAPFALA